MKQLDIHPTTSTEILLPFKSNLILLLSHKNISKQKHTNAAAAATLNPKPQSIAPMKLNSLFNLPSHTSISSPSSNPTLHHPSIFKPKAHLSSPKPSSSSLPTTVGWDHLTSPFSHGAHNPNKRLTHYADLASKLAQDGRFQDFLMIAETVVGSGVSAERFVGLLNLDLFSKGLVRIVGDGGKVGSFVEVLKSAEKLGIRVLDLLDGSAVEAIGRELGRMLKCGQVEEVVDLMEVLAGKFHFVQFCGEFG